MIEQYLRDKIQAFTPRLDADRHAQRRSAVTLLLRDNAGTFEVLMMQRAQREGDPWSGQMCFPGGRMDPQDRHSYDAAVRECWEEVGVDLAKVAVSLGRLSDIHTHIESGPGAMSVSAYLFYLSETPTLMPNHEVADTIWVPLNFLANAENRTTMCWQRGDSEWMLPCYYYREKPLWGLSLRMLDELVMLLEGVRF